jgi:transcription elongation GreA/GreB family factor
MALLSLDKKLLFAELTRRIADEFETLVAAQKATHEGATHEEARPENDKDTRALEQSYLARGQAKRVIDLQAELDQLRALSLRTYDAHTPIGLGALVTLEDEEEKLQLRLLSPAGAGEKLETDKGVVLVVTGRSPLGQSLLGGLTGDDVEVKSPNGPRWLRIVEVV